LKHQFFHRAKKVPISDQELKAIKNKKSKKSNDTDKDEKKKIDKKKKIRKMMRVKKQVKMTKLMMIKTKALKLRGKRKVVKYVWKCTWINHLLTV